MQQLHPSPPLFHTPRTLSGAFLALRNGDKVVWGRPGTASTLCPLHTAGGMGTGRTGRDEHPLLIQRLTGPGGSVQILEGTGRLASAVSAVRLGRAGGCCWLHWCQISCSCELEMPRFSFLSGSTRHAGLLLPCISTHVSPSPSSPLPCTSLLAHPGQLQ